MHHYMLVIWSGFTPELIGPYDKESRDKRAKELLTANENHIISFVDMVDGEHPIFTEVYCDEGKSLTFAKAS